MEKNVERPFSLKRNYGHGGPYAMFMQRKTFHRSPTAITMVRMYAILIISFALVITQQFARFPFEGLTENKID